MRSAAEKPRGTANQMTTANCPTPDCPTAATAPSRPGRSTASGGRTGRNGPLLLAALLLAAGCGRPAESARRSGRPVAAGPLRVASLAPSLTEIVYALGGESVLVGRTDVCNYPPAAITNVPIVGSFGRPSLDALVAQQANLVLVVDLDDKGTTGLMNRLGLRPVRVPCQQLDQIPSAIRTVGELIGHVPAAEQLAGSITAGVAAQRQSVASLPAPRPRVFVELWSNPLMTVGRGSFVAELVTLAGGHNLGDELTSEYANVAPEWVLARDPEVIFCLYMGDRGVAAARVRQRLGWQHLAAVRNGRIYDRFDLDVICRPGPRVLSAIAQFQQALQATPQAPARPAGEAP